MPSLEEFTESYTRIFGNQIKMDEHGNPFFSYFYDTFLSSSDDVAEAFKNTDMPNQHRMLKNSLLYSINFMFCSTSFDTIQKIAISHDRHHHNIKPELYDLWMNAMVETVRQFDPEFSDDVELAWRLAFSQAITFMKFMY